MAGKSVCGASGTPSLSRSSCSAVSRSSSQSASARPPRRSGLHSHARRHPPRVPSVAAGACTSAYPARSARLSSGSTCATLASFPTKDRARFQCTRLRSTTSSRASPTAARNSVRFPSGQRSRPSRTPTLIPRAVTGSPTIILAGAACKPSSLSASAVSLACTHARDVARAGSPLPASVCIGSISTPATHAAASPRRRGPPPQPARIARRLRLLHARAALGRGCCLSKAACFICTHAATNVDTRSKPVWSVNPAKSHAPIHHNARRPVRLPPYKTLEPQVGVLIDGAESICRLGVGHVRHCSW
eukprot:6211087-Pleurochrysis_carterae.AAC.2